MFVAYTLTLIGQLPHNNMSCAYCNQQTLQQKWEKRKRFQRYQSTASAMPVSLGPTCNTDPYLGSHEGDGVYSMPVSHEATEQRQATAAQQHGGQQGEHTRVTTHGRGGGEGQLRRQRHSHTSGYTGAFESCLCTTKMMNGNCGTQCDSLHLKKITFTMRGHSDVCATTYSSSTMQFQLSLICLMMMYH